MAEFKTGQKFLANKPLAELLAELEKLCFAHGLKDTIVKDELPKTVYYGARPNGFILRLMPRGLSVSCEIYSLRPGGKKILEDALKSGLIVLPGGQIAVSENKKLKFSNGYVNNFPPIELHEAMGKELFAIYLYYWVVVKRGERISTYTFCEEITFKQAVAACPPGEKELVCRIGENLKIQNEMVISASLYGGRTLKEKIAEWMNK